MKKEDRGFHGPFCFKHGVQPCLFFCYACIRFFKGKGSFRQGCCKKVKNQPCIALMHGFSF